MQDTVRLIVLFQDRTSGDYSSSSTQVHNQLPKTMSEPAIGGLDDIDNVSDSIPVKGSSCDLNLPGQRLLWVATPKPHNAEKVKNSSVNYLFIHFSFVPFI